MSIPQTTRPKDNHASGRWIGRGLIAAIAAVVLLMSAPMLRGMYYGLVPPAPVPASQLPDWRHDLEAALAESAQTGKPVLIDFTASWCPPCRVMDAEVWPDAGVRAAIAARVIPLKLDVDKPASAAPSQRYGIQYIPTILIVDAQGEELARGGYMSADAMVRFLETNTPPGSAPAPAPAPAPGSAAEAAPGA